MILRCNMRRVKCPICGISLMTISDYIFVDFDLREAKEKVFCENCKRRIRFSEKTRLPKFRDFDNSKRSV